MKFRARSAAGLIVIALYLTSLLTPARADGRNRDKSAPIQVSAPVDLSQPLTLDGAIRIALDHQTALGIAVSQLDAARAAVDQSKAEYYPNIAPAYNYNYQKTTQTFNGQQLTGVFSQSLGTIGANLLIFDSFKREETVLVNKYSARAAEHNVYDTRQTIINTVSADYFDLLRQKELVRVAQSSVDRTKTTLDYTKESVAAGASPRKDILQAEADFDNAQVQLLIARNNQNLAQSTLKNAMGILTPLPITTSDLPLAPPPAAADTRTPVDYLKLAFASRQDLQRDAASVDSNRHSVKVANIAAGPQVQASVNEGYNVFPVSGEERTFGTTLTYPLFDGGASRAAVHQAQANLRQSRQQMEQDKQQVQLDVEQAYLQREAARAQYAAAGAAVEAAQANYDAALEAKREGAVSGTLLDIITTQTSL